MMPLNLILEIKVFNYWGIDFMCLFPPFLRFMYMSVAIVYVSKWIEVISC